MIRKSLESLPLRVRLVIVLTALTTVGLALTTGVTAYLMRDDLISRVDGELQSAALIVAGEAIDQQDAEDHGLPTSYLVFIARPGNGYAPVQLTHSTSNTAEPRLPSMTPDSLARYGSAPFTLESEEGEHEWRARVAGVQGTNWTILIAAPLDGVEHTVARLGVLAALIGLVVVLALAALGWWAVRRAMRPLTAIEDTAAAIAEGDLTRRIEVHEANDEVQSLSLSLNTMLGQIERGFAMREASEERMRQFAADASHELRTPLATVRGYAELHRQGALPDAAAVTAAMSRIESEATRMGHLVEDLLTLARLDEEPEVSMTDVDLTVVAAEAVQDARTRAPGREIRLSGLSGEAGRLAPVLVRGSEPRLRQVLANLMTNAIVHTPAQTPIEVRLGPAADPGMTLLEVCDHGPGLHGDNASKVFERFFRADKARSRASGGTGLGLAIVAAIVAQHHGRVGVLETPGGGATFVVELRTAHSQEGHNDL